MATVVGDDTPEEAVLRAPSARVQHTLVRAASRKWHRLNGANQLPRIIEGVTFTDGVATGDAAQNCAA